MITIVGAIAELERKIIVERIRGDSPTNEAQGKSIRTIAKAVKVSKSFVHKTCENSGPQALDIPACQTWKIYVPESDIM